MRTATKHPVPDRVKLSFAIFDIRALSVRMSKIANDGSGTCRMLYSCTHMSTVGVKVLSLRSLSVCVSLYRLTGSKSRLHLVRCVTCSGLIPSKTSVRRRPQSSSSTTTSAAALSSTRGIYLFLSVFSRAGLCESNVSVRLSVRHAPVLCQNEES